MMPFLLLTNNINLSALLLKGFFKLITMDISHQLSALLHVALAAFLSGLIGLEREKEKKPAGIRTNMIVGGSTALLVILGEMSVKYFLNLGFEELIRFDPTRILQAIVIGISFIGAGTVLQVQQKRRIRFLTTAATFLFSAGIGVAVAFKLYWLSIGVTLLILIINMVLGNVEDRLFKNK